MESLRWCVARAAGEELARMLREYSGVERRIITRGCVEDVGAVGQYTIRRARRLWRSTERIRDMIGAIRELRLASTPDLIPQSEKLKRALAEEVDVPTGEKYIRRCITRQAITQWNGYGYATVGWRVRKWDLARAKREYEANKRTVHTHIEYVECSRCEGYGLVWRNVRRHGLEEAVEVRCGRCGGSGSVPRRVRGKGPDEVLEWDGTLTSTWKRNGFITEEEAERIREVCKKRHTETRYDELLAQGMSKEDAREEIREEMNQPNA